MSVESDDGGRIWSNRRFSAADMDRIRSIIQENPDASRARLATLTCQELDWRGADGRLRDMRCRVVMLRMHEAGLISLPPPRNGFNHAQPDRWRHHALTDPGEPITDPVHHLKDRAIRTVSARDARESRCWNATIAAYHYLGYQRIVGHQIRYLVTSQDRPLALLGFASAAWKTAPRDRYIGWTADQRAHRLTHIANNTRFLILPWVQAPNLASWILARALKQLACDWPRITGVPLLACETFVQADRYTGHCYRAANWLHLGTTDGRGRYDRYSRRAVPPKHVFLRLIDPRACQRLSAD
jgi:hypothetical protein